MSWKRNTFVGILVVVGFLIAVVSVAAAQSTSPSYRVDEYYFGTGGELEACSNGAQGGYCSKQSAGETAVGRTASNSYQAQAGFNTTYDPVLEVAVNGNIDFGVLALNTTASGTANIQVRTYLASGYNMVIAGSAPTSGSSNLDPMTTPGASQAGTEQFGINMRNNATPNVGADPVQVPDSTFSFGIPSADYNTADSYKYQDGDIIAYSNSSSGQTNYTLSMIANMSNLTPAGVYTSGFSIIVTSSF